MQSSGLAELASAHSSKRALPPSLPPSLLFSRPNRDFPRAGSFALGCNYWASHAGTHPSQAVLVLEIRLDSAVFKPALNAIDETGFSNSITTPSTTRDVPFWHSGGTRTNFAFADSSVRSSNVSSLSERYQPATAPPPFAKTHSDRRHPFPFPAKPTANPHP